MRAKLPKPYSRGWREESATFIVPQNQLLRWTVVKIGNLGSSRRAEVGSGGQTHMPDGVELQWWVRSGDKWHVPSVDVTVRDWMLDNAPMLKSALRVPGGDVTAVVYSSVQGPRELVVFELSNSTKAPLAAGFVVRSSSGKALTIQGSTVMVGDRPALYLPSAPADVIVGPLAPLVADSEVNRDHVDPAVLTPGDGVTELLVVIPLLHHSSIRAAALLGVSSALGTATTPVISAIPDPDMVSRGWRLQAKEAARIDGDEVVANRVRQLSSSLLLAFDTADSSLTDRAALVRGLVRIGAYDEALRLCTNVDEWQQRNGSLDVDGDVAVTAQALAAVVTLGRHHPSPTFAHAVVPLVAGALEFIHRAAKRHPVVVEAHAGVFLGAAQMLDRVGETRAAKSARGVWKQLGGAWPMARAMEPALPAITTGASLVPGDIPRLVNAVVGTIDGLVRDEADGSLELFSGWTTAELAGRPIAIHEADSPYGKVSAAVRWHGARPALLWDIACAPADQPVLRCSVLDPAWSTTLPVGEALLGEPPL
jgi:hypothetical protein